jgi:hypothetical protein
MNGLFEREKMNVWMDALVLVRLLASIFSFLFSTFFPFGQRLTSNGGLALAAFWLLRTTSAKKKQTSFITLDTTTLHC